MLSKLGPDSLILGPRPGKRSFDRLSKLELTHCCTLLSEREQASAIEKISQRLGCQWVWLPIDGGNLETLQATDLPARLNTLAAAIADTETPRVYLHCSAGIHRTGFFAYLVLRMGGRSPADALTALNQLREVTAADVGESRIELAETLLGSDAFESLQRTIR